MTKGPYSALIAGATGLVGGVLLKKLVDTELYSRITILTRRSVGMQDERLREIITTSEELDQHVSELQADHVFCCLGTTMKKAGSKEAFKKVDLEYPTRLADLALSQDSKHYLLVSAAGADKNSVIFYNQVKGEVEERISKSGFSKVTIVRPALILGDRNESRTGEAIAQALFRIINPMLIGPLRKYRAVPAADIASTLFRSAIRQEDPMQTIESVDIKP